MSHGTALRAVGTDGATDVCSFGNIEASVGEEVRCTTGFGLRIIAEECSTSENE